MVRNYFKIAFRNLLRNKKFTLINVSGLAVGIASFLFIVLFVNYEWSFDNYHENYNEIYRVLHANSVSDDNDGSLDEDLNFEKFSAQGNSIVGSLIRQNIPEVKSMCRISEKMARVFHFDDNKIRVENIYYADSTLLDVFSWKMVSGNPKTCLTKPNSIILTKSTAKRLFGNQDPLGKTLKRIQPRGEAWLRTVTGVIEDVPANSHINVNAIVSMPTLKGLAEQRFSQWGFNYFYTYVLANNKVSFNQLNGKVSEVVKSHAPSSHENYKVALERFSDIYLHSKAKQQIGVTGNNTGIYIFIFIGSFILLIACVNFINLSTARSVERAKEVGVRKTLGAEKQTLVLQFLVESVLIVFVATLLALILIWGIMPLMEMVSGKPLVFNTILSWQYTLMLLAIILGVGLLAGSYPALVLSRFQPHKVLKGRFTASSGGIVLKNGLTLVQFCLSVILVAGSVVAYKQLDYIQNVDMGFDDDHLIAIDFGYDDTVHGNLSTIKNEFLKRSDVISVSSTYAVPNDAFFSQNLRLEVPSGEMKRMSLTAMPVDIDFIDNYNMDVVEGRQFSTKFSLDSTKAIVLNETAVKAFGYDSPEEILNKKFKRGNQTGQVIGVVKDFNYASLHNSIEPMFLWLAPKEYYGKFSIRMQTTDINETLMGLESLWNRLVPKRPFFYQFLDKSFEQKLNADRRFGYVFAIFTVIAICITCMGLFALTTYTVNQRTKELGVRKVLGASVSNIVYLLSKDIYKLLAISSVFSIPISWYIMNRWLGNFAYRINLSVGIYVVSIILVLCIAAITVGWQSIKAAISNPIKALKEE